MSKHYGYLEVFIRCGEYEFVEKHLIHTEGKSLTQAAQRLVRNYYEGDREKSDEGYYFHAGSIFCKEKRLIEIDETAFYVMHKVMSPKQCFFLDWSKDTPIGG